MLAPAGTPAAVVLPRSTDDVVAVMRMASRHGVPIVPRGAGSGLAGASNAVDGAISWYDPDGPVLEVDAADRLAVVQPGVVNKALRDAVAGTGLFYPPDPSSYDWCTIGGNLSTNAGGLCCVKYGVTTDAVLGLEVVLAAGEVLRTGRRTVKGVAGYDLTRLFVGSEGTLGVITEATLALRPGAAAPGHPGRGVRDDARRPARWSNGDHRRPGAEPARGHGPAPASARSTPAHGRPRPGPRAADRRSPTPGRRPPSEIAAMDRGCRQAPVRTSCTPPTTRPRATCCWPPAGWRCRRWSSWVARSSTTSPCPAPGSPSSSTAATTSPRTPARHRRRRHAGDGNIHPTIVFDRADPDQRDRPAARSTTSWSRPLPRRHHHRRARLGAHQARLAGARDRAVALDVHRADQGGPGPGRSAQPRQGLPPAPAPRRARGLDLAGRAAPMTPWRRDQDGSSSSVGTPPA